MAGKRRKFRYWLRGGTETCEICGSRYVLQVEYRCDACDAGLCGNCALTVHETHEVFCSPCHDTPAGSEKER